MPDPVVVQETAYYEGVADVYYALITNTESTATAASYGTPKVLGKTIDITVTPRFVEGSLYASNSAVRRVKKLDGYDVAVTADQLLATVRQEVLGRSTDTNGVEILSGDTVAPYLALAIAVTKDNNEKTLWWLYKGQASELDISAKTRDNTIQYQTPQIKFACDRRIHDNLLGVVVDTDDPEIGTSVASGWFSAVYEPVTSSSGGSGGSGGSSGD